MQTKEFVHQWGHPMSHAQQDKDFGRRIEGLERMQRNVGGWGIVVDVIWLEYAYRLCCEIGVKPLIKVFKRVPEFTVMKRAVFMHLQCQP
jgi:hypothetical protein